MLRILILVVMAVIAGFVAMPFVMTSRALDEHGVVLPGTVYNKSEYVKTVYSSWELERKITIEYTVPETSSVGFFAVYPSAQQYDSLHTKQAVEVRYLPRKDVPDVPGADMWWQMHALQVAKLAHFEGVSRFDALRTPLVMLGCQIAGGILVLVILWRVTRVRMLGWAAALGAIPLIGLILLSGFPRPTPAPVRDLRQATGRVTNIGRIDKLFSGSRSRGAIAEQPVDVVSVEFVPSGMTEPVLAVDLIDRGSIPGLKEKGEVTLDYEAASPRTAYLRGATRAFPEKNFSGAVMGAGLYVAAIVVLLVAANWLGRGYRRLISR